MKKVLLAYGILLLIVVALLVAKFRGFDFVSSITSSRTAVVNNQEFKLLIADNDKSRQIGLSGKNSLDQKTGMLFIFPKKGKYSFWMKNTKIPLDIIFIDNNKIVHIAKNAPAQKDNQINLPIYTPPTEIDKVLEINGGLSEKFNIKNGDIVTFKNVNLNPKK